MPTTSLFSSGSVESASRLYLILNSTPYVKIRSSRVCMFHVMHADHY